jgi:hypothetical protein
VECGQQFAKVKDATELDTNALIQKRYPPSEYHSGGKKVDTDRWNSNPSTWVKLEDMTEEVLLEKWDELKGNECQ